MVIFFSLKRSPEEGNPPFSWLQGHQWSYHPSTLLLTAWSLHDLKWLLCTSHHTHISSSNTKKDRVKRVHLPALFNEPSRKPHPTHSPSSFRPEFSHRTQQQGGLGKVISNSRRQWPGLQSEFITKEEGPAGRLVGGLQSPHREPSWF